MDTIEEVYKQSINIGKVDGGVGGAVLLSPADYVSIYKKHIAVKSGNYVKKHPLSPGHVIVCVGNIKSTCVTYVWLIVRQCQYFN